MPITFHCEHCGNKITAKDESAGKWGHCPACHNKIYVPNLNVEIDDLKLAPIDEDSEAKRKQLLAETHKITLDILSIKDELKTSYAAAQTTPIEDNVLEERIILYLKRTGEGKLDQAQKIEQQIAPYGKQAINIIDQLSGRDTPPSELAGIPKAVLTRIMRNLRTKIM